MRKNIYNGFEERKHFGRLIDYVEVDKTYQNYKKGIQPKTELEQLSVLWSGDIEWALNELERLNNNWNKLKKWAEKPQVYICNYHIVDKMNEIEVMKMKMKIEELVLARCMKNIDPWGDKDIGLEIGKFYVVEEINIGQSNSSIKINGKSYNSILFEYYNDYLDRINIYNSKYSPYNRVNKIGDDKE